MAKYLVEYRNNKWVADGPMGTSTHSTKGAAGNAARRKASDGERIAIYRRDGTFQETIRVGDSVVGFGGDSGDVLGL